MSSPKKQPLMALAIDLGSAFAAMMLYVAGKFYPIESPMDGSQVPTIAYHNPKTDKWHFGRDAVMQSYDDPGDNVFMHTKRSFFEHPHELLYGGRFSAAEVLTEFLKHIRALILAARVELAEYPQFGGNGKPAEELAIVFTTPANWGMEQHAEYDTVIQEAGFLQTDGFIAEPIAAARHAVRSSNLQLTDSKVLLVGDVGAGTSDLTFLKQEHGVYDQLASASGDAYLAGHDFTAAVAQRISLEHDIPFTGAYGKGGLNLSDVHDDHRPGVLAAFFAAEEAKKKLSVLEDVTVPLELPSGRKTFRITREEAAIAWAPLLERFKECIRQSIEESEIDPEKIDYPILAGGSSRLPGLRQAMAEALGRPVTDVIVCTDSEHIVAAGATELVYFQDQGSQELVAGLGCKVFDRRAETYRYLLLVEPGQIIPVDGLFLEREGFGIDTSSGVRSLLVEPFACKTGVRAKLTPGRDTFLQVSETVALEYLEASLEDFPDADHAVSIGVRLGPGLSPRLLVRPLSLPDVEPLSIPLTLAQKNGRGKVRVFDGKEVVVLLDLSKSIRGEKLRQLTGAVIRFREAAKANGVAVAFAAFGGSPGKVDRARVIAPFDASDEEVHHALNNLEAVSGTFMAEGLSLAHQMHQERNSEALPVVLMFTDGMPASRDEALAAAIALKDFGGMLACVGIGEDVVEPFLRSLASYPELYRFADAPEDIFQQFGAIAEVLWGGSEEQYDEDSHYED